MCCSNCCTEAALGVCRLRTGGEEDHRHEVQACRGQCDGPQCRLGVGSVSSCEAFVMDGVSVRRCGSSECVWRAGWAPDPAGCEVLGAMDPTGGEGCWCGSGIRRAATKRIESID